MMENVHIRLVPADLSLAEQAAEYYQKNREFLKAFEPARSEDFFSPAYQREILRKEIQEFEAKNGISLLYHGSRSRSGPHRQDQSHQCGLGSFLLGLSWI